MKYENLKQHIGKILFVIMKNHFHYQGECINVSEEILTLIDRKNCEVQIDIQSISSVEVKNGKYK